MTDKRPVRHKSCYGTMLPEPFPTEQQPESERPEYRGKVFSLEAITPAGMMPQRRWVVTNLDEWDDCLQCPEFGSCYKLCMARLQLQESVGDW